MTPTGGLLLFCIERPLQDLLVVAVRLSQARSPSLVPLHVLCSWQQGPRRADLGKGGLLIVCSCILDNDERRMISLARLPSVEGYPC